MPSSFATPSGLTPFWVKIGDGKPPQFLFKGEVNFVKYPGWFMGAGHPLGHFALTKNLKFF